MKPREKVRENRLRRMADRQGLRLDKSRRRDPNAVDYGMYRLVDKWNNIAVYGASSFDFEASLDEIEEYLTN